MAVGYIVPSADWLPVPWLSGQIMTRGVAPPLSRGFLSPPPVWCCFTELPSLHFLRNPFRRRWQSHLFTSLEATKLSRPASVPHTTCGERYHNWVWISSDKNPTTNRVRSLRLERAPSFTPEASDGPAPCDDPRYRISDLNSICNSLRPTRRQQPLLIPYERVDPHYLHFVAPGSEMWYEYQIIFASVIWLDFDILLNDDGFEWYSISIAKGSEC